MEEVAAIQRTEIMPLENTGVKLETIILSELRQAQFGPWLHSYVESKKKISETVRGEWCLLEAKDSRVLGRERGKLVNEGELTVRNKRLWEPLRGAATVKDVSDFSGGRRQGLWDVWTCSVCASMLGAMSVKRTFLQPGINKGTSILLAVATGCIQCYAVVAAWSNLNIIPCIHVGLLRGIRTFMLLCISYRLKTWVNRWTHKYSCRLPLSQSEADNNQFTLYTCTKRPKWTPL